MRVDTQGLARLPEQPHNVISQGGIQRKPRVVIITTAPQTLRAFFPRQVRDLTEAGFEMHAISSPGEDMDAGRAELGIPISAVSMTRRISLFDDLAALWHLVRALRAIDPDIIQTHTPKAGLLGMVASALIGVPVRIYTVNGLVWEHAAGWRRLLLRQMDRLAVALATRVLCVSPSVRNIMGLERLCHPQFSTVLGSGGSHGVDLDRFDPSRFSAEMRLAVRQRNGLPGEGLLVAFVGRFVKDKGIGMLMEAWKRVSARIPEATLVLVGERESSHPIPELLWSRVVTDPKIIVLKSPPNEMPEIYSVLDLLILPSRREGLPNALLEAGAMQIPVIATRVTGCIDVVVEGRTGVLTESTPDDLASAISNLLADPESRRRMGEQARRHIAEHFSEQNVSLHLAREYWRLLGECGYPINRKAETGEALTKVHPLPPELNDL